MDGWIDSKVAVFPLLKIGAKPVRIIVEGKPNAKYDPKLDSILIDGKLGGVSRTAKEYVGITKPNVRLLIELDKPKELSQVAVSFLEDIEKGAFPPEYIEVWAGEEKNSLQKIAMVKAALPSEKRSPFKDLLVLNFEKVRARYVRVNIKISRRLPSWPSLQKDVQPSGFVDEVALD
jgi:hexosaminidase